MITDCETFFLCIYIYYRLIMLFYTFDRISLANNKGCCLRVHTRYRVIIVYRR